MTSFVTIPVEVNPITAWWVCEIAGGHRFLTNSDAVRKRLGGRLLRVDCTPDVVDLHPPASVLDTLGAITNGCL